LGPQLWDASVLPQHHPCFPWSRRVRYLIFIIDTAVDI
jgi:hypothetical protein